MRGTVKLGEVFGFDDVIASGAVISQALAAHGDKAMLVCDTARTVPGGIARKRGLGLRLNGPQTGGSNSFIGYNPANKVTSIV